MLSAEALRHAFAGGRGEGGSGGRVVALDDVTFTLDAGQTLAVFGPNGAGKTTLLKVLAGLIRPDAGRATVAGGRGAIGWIGHQSHLYGHLTVRENLLFWAALYRVPAATRARRAGAAGACRPGAPTSTGGLSGRAVGDWLSQAWTVARKDLLLEFRTRTAIVSALVFTALVLTLFNFGRDPTAVPTIDLAPTILWVTFTFAAMLAMNRAFQLELENDALEGLLASPLSRTSLYWGKLLANLVFVAVVEVVGLPLFVLFFDVPVAPVLGPLIAVIALATVGFVAVGTLFSALVIRTRFAELLLVVILLPFLLPPLIGAVQVTARLLGDRPLSEAVGYLKLLAAYDIVFVSLASFLFRFTVDE